MNINGTDGNDTLIGSDKDDRIDGKGGDDQIYGNKGNDILNGGLGIDTLDGGEGTADFADYSNYPEQVDVSLIKGTTIEFGGSTVVLDVLSNIEGVFGSSFRDRIDGDDANNILDGKAGDDDVFGGGGNDLLFGGDGNDYLDSNGLSFNTADEINFLYGGAGDDTLGSREGNEILVGDSGDDLLTNGSGTDTLLGGSGSDKFLFAFPTNDVDKIVDFSSDSDTLNVLAFGFGQEIQPGPITADQLYLGSSAQDTSDRFIYNIDSGALSFDPDGTGSAAQVQFAELSNKIRITADDIVVI